MTYISNIQNCHGDEHYLTDLDFQILITDKALDMLEDPGNYTLMADVLDDLSDD